MTPFSSPRRLGWLVSLLGVSGFAVLGGACSDAETDDEHVDSADSALTGAQCDYFDVNGKVQICHLTSSASHPYTIIKTSVQGCINGHAGHPGDYITSTDPSSPTYDPTCQGGGCLPVGAPTDATLECCDGLVSQNGTCVDLCAGVTCAASDQCHAAGTCNPADGTCSNPAVADGTTCSDGNGCTVDDACTAGVCTPGAAVVCGASDSCHAAGTCNPADGTCSNPAVADGTPCSDGDGCSVTDACVAGTCTGSGNPCQNGGTCQSVSNAYTCSCAPGYEGTNCETSANPCAPNPCNGGICTVAGEGYTCDCTGLPAQGVNCAETCPCTEFNWAPGYPPSFDSVLRFGKWSNSTVTVATTSWGIGAAIVGTGGFGYYGTSGAFVNTQEHACGVATVGTGMYGLAEYYDYHAGLTAGQELACVIGLERAALAADVSVTSSPASADGCAPNPCGAGANCYNLVNTSGGYLCN
ncbi:calcium-binding EGF-like domain-containing protein [Sorangium sp. So ce388]|uniref:calcium-binding EGF-like domain-containing protein n=1 Tax=Sorangium sp. So ce388 TaxID=3133309 RepID=UPI003F5BA878